MGVLAFLAEIALLLYFCCDPLGFLGDGELVMAVGVVEQALASDVTRDTVVGPQDLRGQALGHTPHTVLEQLSVREAIALGPWAASLGISPDILPPRARSIERALVLVIHISTFVWLLIIFFTCWLPGSFASSAHRCLCCRFALGLCWWLGLRTLP